MSQQQPLFHKGMYKLCAVAAQPPGELRPAPVLITATVHFPGSPIGQQLKGMFYLGKFRLSLAQLYISVEFDKAVQAFSLVDIERDCFLAYKLADSNKNTGLIRDLYPDGQVVIRRK